MVCPYWAKVAGEPVREYASYGFLEFALLFGTRKDLGISVTLAVVKDRDEFQMYKRRGAEQPLALTMYGRMLRCRVFFDPASDVWTGHCCDSSGTQ